MSVFDGRIKKAGLAALVCCLIALVLIASYILLDHVLVRQTVFASFPAMTAEEQIEKAHLIVKGTFKDKSKAFQIQPANGGDPSNFTDYYLTVEEVYRGDASVDDVIPVRVQEGFVGTVWVETAHEPNIRLGDQVLIYLYQTDEGYYYVLNGKSGYWTLEGEGQICNAWNGDIAEIAEVEATIKKVHERESVRK